MTKEKMTVWKSTQLMSSHSYEIFHYLDKDFKTVEMHSHDFYELYYFIKGSASYIVEDGHYSLESGDILLISPSNLHQLDIKDSLAAYERMVLWINPVYLEKISTTKTDLATCFKMANERGAHLIRNERISSKVHEELESLLLASKSPSFGSDLEAESKIRNILIILGEYFLTNKEAEISLSEENPLVSSVIGYINSHIDEDLSLEKIATALYVSKYYLSHVFKEKTNTAPHQYILKKRLLLSKEYIARGMKIQAVYSKCGFRDYTHYFRAFKQEYGITPKEYLFYQNK